MDKTMKLTELTRYILGYIIGISVFFVAIPWGLYLLAQVQPVGIVENPAVRWVFAVPLFVAGIVFVMWSNAELLRIGKGGPADGFNVVVSPRTKHLVTTGPYKYTRNPMVFGALSTYFAVALYLNSAADLVALIIFTYFVRIYLRLTEEKRLEQDFGDEYREYKKKVPMIFPWPFKHHE